MAQIVVTGGGVAGLAASMLLAEDGHEVTLLERDAAEPPAPTEAWEAWERRGVNQFRLLHFFMPRFRILLEQELPQVSKALEAAGAMRFNPIEGAPVEMTGGARAGDEDFTSITARRPVLEAVLAAAARATPGLTVRRGVAVGGLVAGAQAIRGVPHVTGVRTAAGEEIPADLVVDATGRRSPLPQWLESAGARRPVEELEDSGFVYYGRHFRSADGTTPPPLGPLLQSYGSVSVLTLPADNGTWGVGVISSGADTAMRGLRDIERWTAVVQSLPLAAHWLDGEPIEDRIVTMAKIEDRHRSFTVDGAPVATGVVAVADSWACTNPSLGRGASIGMMHCVALRDTLAQCRCRRPRRLQHGVGAGHRVDRRALVSLHLVVRPSSPGGDRRRDPRRAVPARRGRLGHRPVHLLLGRTGPRLLPGRAWPSSRCSAHPRTSSPTPRFSRRPSPSERGGATLPRSARAVATSCRPWQADADRVIGAYRKERRTCVST